MTRFRLPRSPQPQTAPLSPPMSLAPLALLALALTLLLAAAPDARAHRSNIFAWAEGGEIHIECSFSGGKPVMNSPVQVLDAATGAQVTEATTDAEGMGSFPIPAAARDKRMDLKLILAAGEGHRGEWIITAEEYLGAAPEGESAPAETVAAPAAAPASTAVSMDEATLKRIVDQALDKRLAPLNHKLAAMADAGPTASDIFGGIGWILGLFGIAAYYKSKTRN